MKSGSRRLRAALLEDCVIDLRNRCAAHLRLLPRGEIDAEQFLERLDLGQVALAQVLFLLGRQTAEGSPRP